MLDMAFQLLTFFILTFRPPALEGQIGLRLPPARPPRERNGPSRVATLDRHRPSRSARLTVTVLSQGGQIDGLGVGKEVAKDIRDLAGKLAAVFKNPNNPFEQVVVQAEPQAALRRVDAGGGRVFAADAFRREETGQAQSPGTPRGERQVTSHRNNGRVGRAEASPPETGKNPMVGLVTMLCMVPLAPPTSKHFMRSRLADHPRRSVLHGPETPRLVTMLFMLVVIGMAISRTADPSTWRWLAPGPEAPAPRPAPPRPATDRGETVAGEARGRETCGGEDAGQSARGDEDREDHREDRGGDRKEEAGKTAPKVVNKPAAGKPIAKKPAAVAPKPEPQTVGTEGTDQDWEEEEAISEEREAISDGTVYMDKGEMNAYKRV